jgi:hypothetical protein
MSKAIKKGGKGMSAEYEDHTRVCEDCGRDYIWSAGEQYYFHERGFAAPEALQVLPAR